MALKLELEQWNSGCIAFDHQEFETALNVFISLADNAKMHFNVGLVFATLDDNPRAIQAYTKAVRLDSYFAVAYFQRGVAQFMLGEYEAAFADFDETYKKLRGNNIINYSQLGLNFRLYACEVLFNRGICHLYIGRIDAGLTDLYHAQKDKQTEEHDVIDQAVLDRGKGYSVFSIPPGVIYRPAESKLRNAGRVDYLGTSKVIAAQDMGDQFTGFQGARNQKAAYNNTSAPFQAAGGLGRMNSVMLKTPSSNGQSIPQHPRRPAEQTPNGSPIYTIIPPKRMDSRERLVGTPPNAQGLYPQPPSARAYTSEGRPYTPDGRPHTPDSRPYTPDSRPYTPDSRPYTPDPQAMRNQSSSSNLAAQGQTPLPPIPPKSTRRTSNNNNNNGNHQRRISDQGNNQTLSPLPPGFTPSPSNSSSTPNFPPYELESPDPFRRPRRSRERDSLVREIQASTSTPNFPNQHQSSSSTSSSEARRVDSGFESTHEDRLSSHSRSSSGSASNNIRGAKDAPPLPPLPSMSSRQDEWGRERERERERDGDRERDQRQAPRAPAAHRRNNSSEDGAGAGYYDDMDGILDGMKDVSVADEGAEGRSGKIKIKLHYSDTRVLLVSSTIDFGELTQRVQDKFDAPAPLRLSYRDEENELVLMIDQDDFQMAKSISRAKETGPVGAVEKLELWCFE